MYNTNSKRKSMIFSKKKIFFDIFDFFSKGGTLWCRNRQKKNFPFFKNFKNKTQKWLSWDHSNTNRNKVMNFGGRSSYPAETARLFIRAIMAPSAQNRVKWKLLNNTRHTIKFHSDLYSIPSISNWPNNDQSRPIIYCSYSIIVICASIISFIDSIIT